MFPKENPSARLPLSLSRDFREKRLLAKWPDFNLCGSDFVCLAFCLYLWITVCVNGFGHLFVNYTMK